MGKKRKLLGSQSICEVVEDYRMKKRNIIQDITPVLRRGGGCGGWGGKKKKRETAPFRITQKNKEPYTLKRKRRATLQE